MKKIISVHETKNAYPYKLYAVTIDGELYGLESNFETLHARKKKVWNKLPSIPSERKKKK